MRRVTPEQIDALLPQTQCGLCGYGGCMPYAEALVYEQAAINLCPPGGVETLHALGHLLNEDAAPFVAGLEERTKPTMVAVIRESECIGCTKCIQACPVDAILGSAKQMHSVIMSECTGCDLCVPACPVDCIDMIAVPHTQQRVPQAKKDLARLRYQAREHRLLHQASLKASRQSQMTVTHKKRKEYIQEAIERAKRRRANSNK